MPTNGIGLGHAQRCALIAARARPRRGSQPVFAAFPSCMRLIKSYGFDAMPLIGRSALHAQTHENDLANYLRLRALTAGARARWSSTAATSSTRSTASILENRLPGRLDPPRALAGRPGQLDRARPREGVRPRHRAERGLRRAERRLFARRPRCAMVGPIVQRIGLGARPPRRRCASGSPSASGGASTGWWSRCSAPGSPPTAARRSRRSAA